MLNQMGMDIRYAIRTLRKNRAFTAVAILVLALGIGTTTAIFSVVNAVLIRPLPYKDPARLVAVSTLYRRVGVSNTSVTVSLEEVERWRGESKTLESVGSFVFSAEAVNIGMRAMYLAAIGADPELLTTLGVQPALGWNLSGSGSRVKDPSVMISHRLWVEAFERDPGVVGRTLIGDGMVSTIVGVLPASFAFPRSDASYFPEDPDIVYPVANIADSWGRRSPQWFAIGRLHAGVPAMQAESELNTIMARMTSVEPTLAGTEVRLTALAAATTSKVRSALLLSLGISLVLLLIACTNIMNLLFSRAEQRAREMAVRKAIGATTARLVRQMLTESACLTFLAGAVGVGLARLVIDMLVRLSPAHLPLSGRVEIDWTVLSFAVVVCAVAAILSGVLPAIQRGRQTESLIVMSPRSIGSRALLRMQRGLMVAQIALGVGLLAAAGVLTHSLWRLNAVNPGFRTQDTIGFELAFPGGRPSEAPQRCERILEATRAIPGVASAGWITNPPPETRAGVFIAIAVVGSQNAGRRPYCNFQVTSEDYFRTAGMAFSRGRDFTRADTAGSPRVVIINETLARQYLPNADPVGQRITTAFGGSTAHEIVGVVRDIHDRGLNAKPVPTVYVPLRQFSFPYGGIVVQTNAPAESVLPEIRRRVAQADSTVALKSLMTIASRVRRTLDAPRFYTIMAAACASMAVLFVALGLFGVVSYAVSRRTAEIGIRMALGAAGGTILQDVLWQGLRIAAVGIVIGIGLSLAATRLLAALLFEVKPVDPPTLALASGVVVLVTLAASYLPARRASLVHPLAALRHE